MAAKDYLYLFFILAFSLWVSFLLLVYSPISDGITPTFLSNINNILAIFLVSAALSSLTALLIGLEKLGKLSFKKPYDHSQTTPQPEILMPMRVVSRFSIEEVVRQRGSGEPPVEEYINKVDEESVEMSPEELFVTLDQLKNEFKIFETIREGIMIRIASLAKLVPKLTETTELLEKDIMKNQKGVQQLTHQVSVLNEQIAALLKSIPQKQEQTVLLETQIALEQDKIKKITDQMSKLTCKRKKLAKFLQQKQDEISKIDEQINQIKSVQERSLNLVSLLAS